MKKTEIIFLSVLGLTLMLCLLAVIAVRCEQTKQVDYGTIDHSDGIITDTRTNNADNPINYYNRLMFSNDR